MFRSLATLTALALTLSPALAQEVTLKLHQFLPETSFIPAEVLTPWADKVEKDSGGRIKIERFANMALGGKPADLADQVTDGVADIVWTLPGYTPGRFPRTEVMELPFMVTDTPTASATLWTMAEGWAGSDFRDMHLLGIWVHSPSAIHSSKPVTRLADMAGQKLRAPSRLAAAFMEKAGAAPVGMPAPAIAEALSKGVIDGALLPWEVTSSIRVDEFVTNHTEFPGRAIYTGVQILAMNKASYDALPDDLKKVIDDASGLEFSRATAAKQLTGDAAPREATIAKGGKVTAIEGDAAAEWHALADQVVAEWIAGAQGFDAQALVDQARAAMTR